jgi:hypothetical protein
MRALMMTNQHGGYMGELFKLEELLRSLLVEDRLLFEEGDWDALAQVRMSIDAVRDQITSLKGE